MASPEDSTPKSIAVAAEDVPASAVENNALPSPAVGYENVINFSRAAKGAAQSYFTAFEIQIEICGLHDSVIPGPPVGASCAARAPATTA